MSRVKDEKDDPRMDSSTKIDGQRATAPAVLPESTCGQRSTRLDYVRDRLRQASAYHEDVAKHSYSGWHEDTALMLTNVSALIVDAVNSQVGLIAQRDDLLAALKAVLAGFECGDYVRDISRDGESGWALRSVAVLKPLVQADAAIKKAEGREP